VQIKNKKYISIIGIGLYVFTLYLYIYDQMDKEYKVIMDTLYNTHIYSYNSTTMLIGFWKIDLLYHQEHQLHHYLNIGVHSKKLVFYKNSCADTNFTKEKMFYY